MTNERLFDREGLQKEKIKDKKEKSTSFHTCQSQQKDYDIGNLLWDIGNQEITKFLELGSMQAKLNVSQPGDIYEQEADKIANNIVDSNTKQSPKINNIKRRPAAKNKPGNSNIESKIKGLKGKGNPLNRPVREYFEARFDVDFGSISVHKGIVGMGSLIGISGNDFSENTMAMVKTMYPEDGNKMVSAEDYVKKVSGNPPRTKSEAERLTGSNNSVASFLASAAPYIDPRNMMYLAFSNIKIIPPGGITKLKDGINTLERIGVSSTANYMKSVMKHYNFT